MSAEHFTAHVVMLCALVVIVGTAAIVARPERVCRR
jgi:hypothetical protein